MTHSDTPASRTLRTAAYTDVTGMTIESCTAFCASGGYAYAGVEYYRVNCDNTIESPGAPIDESTCNTPCAGDFNEICGGAGGLSVYQDTALPPPPPPPPAAEIKQTAGVFEFVGCFEDGVNGAARSLQTQLNIQTQSVTAESCTAACKAAGYVLAGLEYGQECWCDSYMPLAISTPNSDCNMPCTGDATEICGAGNRLAVYQDSTAPPLDVQTCLTNAQLHASGSGRFQFNLAALPVDGGASQVVGNYELPAMAGQPTYFFLSALPFDREAHSFSLGGNVLYPDSFEGEGNPIPLEPSPGGSQRFAAWSTFTPYAGYCAKPNFVSPFGVFIGPPVLSVSGHADLWALCSGTSVVYAPAANATGCEAVVLEMTQYDYTY
ncbi:hypothetical protein CVT26_005864 [Gymnopilus dilepis]|uniref:WSC domain-containing protein n=1 Tax=Gymnopilus dilepis TaxID=231916 RepID=A0A409Y1F6_9AGAR|nr:hypothetical protein CVT26_005864 [Gymnopilus dilepis]